MAAAAHDPLKDLFDFLDEDGITTPPIKSTKHPAGKVYVVPSPNAATGQRLSALADISVKMARKLEVTEAEAARLQLNDDEERDFLEMVLGTCYAELIADGVSWQRIKRLGLYAFTYFGVSPEAANEALRSGAWSGKAPTTNRAQRRAATTGKAPTTGTASTGSRAPRTAARKG